mmetsp:Transcript_19805/g.41245  ORF Transcript_19805/g.41245 Transcript_19805/m.41245 type:complete len:103 (-) Transcript_19805:1108-1416(-)
MMYSLFSFLLVLQGSAAFTTPSVKLTRSSFVSKPFFVATELKSEDTPAEEATAVDADQVVSEAVDEAIAEISDEEEEDKKRVLRERYTVFLGNLPFGESVDK